MAYKNSEWKRNWNSIRSQRQQTNCVMITRMAQYGGRIYVSVPSRDKEMSKEFGRRAYAAGGRWKPRSVAWVFDPDSRVRIVKLVREVFGNIKIKMAGFSAKGSPQMEQPTSDGSDVPWD